MLRIALEFCAGAAGVHALPHLLPAAALAAPALASFCLWRRRRAGAAFLAGFVWTHLLASHWLESGWSCERDRQEQVLTGLIGSHAIQREGRIDFDLEVAKPAWPGRAPGRVRISWYEAAVIPRPGERWRMTVRLRCRHGFANPGAPDRELDLLRQRIDATGYVVANVPPTLLQPSAGRPIERLRSRIAGAITDAVPAGASAAVLQGLAVGVRGGIPDELWETFAVTGVAHLMAISGLHVTGCALFVLVILRLAWRTPWLSRVRARLPLEAGVVVAVTAAYTLLAGASLPALRTLAMVAVAGCLRLLRRALPIDVLLAIVAVALVATDPLALASPGFWLSMVATAALFTVVNLGTGWRGRIAVFARAQAAVTTLLTPVLAASFGRVSLVSPLANAAAIPFFSAVVLPAVLAATTLEAAWPGCASGLWRALAVVLDTAWPWLSAMARWPGSSWAPPAPSAFLILVAGMGILAALVLPLCGLRFAACAMLGAILFAGGARPQAGAWTLTVVDVGQGLAAIVETQRHVLVFDTGPRWQGGSAAARVSIVPYLRSRGIRRIDILVVSHDDSDHAGGVEALGRAFDVVRTMTEPESAHAADERCEAGRTWAWDGVEFRVLHPSAGFTGDENDRSCTLAVRGRGGSALLLADAQAAGEAAMLRASLRADVVLLPHHGSRTSSTPPLVAAVQARLGIASAGFGNRWGMPAADVVARWRAAGTTVLDTAAQGAVTVRFPARPGALDVTTARHDAPRWWRAVRSQA